MPAKRSKPLRGKAAQIAKRKAAAAAAKADKKASAVGALADSGVAIPADATDIDIDELHMDESYTFSRGRVNVHATNHVHLEALSITRAGKELLSGATLHLNEAGRYCLIGANGVGKSTLFNRIYHRRIKGLSEHLTIAIVRQEVAGTARTPVEWVVDADEDRRRLLAEQDWLLADDNADGVNTDAGCARLQEVHASLDAIDAYTAEERAVALLTSLGFDDASMRQATSTLSGGWRMKTALACALFVTPHILLLDEPTNHLDLPSRVWLEGVLRKFSGILVVISHDRAFLTAVTDRVIVFRQKQLTNYDMKYEDYLTHMKERHTKQVRLQDALDKKRDHMKASVQKMQQSMRSGKQSERSQRAGKQIACRLTQIHKKGLERNEDGTRFVCQTAGFGFRPGSLAASGVLSAGTAGKRVAQSTVDSVDPPVVIKFLDPDLSTGLGSSGVTKAAAATASSGDSKSSSADKSSPPAATPTSDPVIRISNLNFAFPVAAGGSGETKAGNLIVRDTSINVHVNSRIALVGANGCGKSTLLRIMANDPTLLKPLGAKKNADAADGSDTDGEPDATSTPVTSSKTTPQPTLRELCGPNTVWRHHNVKLGFFSQHAVDALDPQTTPLQHMIDVTSARAASAFATSANADLKPASSTSEQALRTHLGRFGLHGRTVLQRIGTLSGGQKARVVLADVTFHRPDVLLLDEPSNHLDMATIDALIDACRAFRGGIVLVSHDQHFIESVCNEIYVAHTPDLVLDAAGVNGESASTSVRNRRRPRTDAAEERAAAEAADARAKSQRLHALRGSKFVRTHRPLSDYMGKLARASVARKKRMRAAAAAAAVEPSK